MLDLAAEFGGLDIDLFDQLLRGRIAPGMRVLDAGCGSGRNLVYLLRARYDVCGADAAAIESVRNLAARLAPLLAADNFLTEPVEAMTFPDHHADVVVCSAVLHFARLVDEPLLMGSAAALGAQAADPLKKTVVHGQRSMTTWELRKGGWRAPGPLRRRLAPKVLVPQHSVVL